MFLMQMKEKSVCRIAEYPSRIGSELLSDMLGHYIYDVYYVFVLRVCSFDHSRLSLLSLATNHTSQCSRLKLSPGPGLRCPNSALTANSAVTLSPLFHLHFLLHSLAQPTTVDTASATTATKLNALHNSGLGPEFRLTHDSCLASPNIYDCVGSFGVNARPQPAESSGQLVVTGFGVSLSKRLISLSLCLCTSSLPEQECHTTNERSSPIDAASTTIYVRQGLCGCVILPNRCLCSTPMASASALRLLTLCDVQLRLPSSTCSSGRSATTRTSNLRRSMNASTTIYVRQGLCGCVITHVGARSTRWPLP